jgi:hypothetical protein
MKPPPPATRMSSLDTSGPLGVERCRRHLGSRLPLIKSREPIDRSGIRRFMKHVNLPRADSAHERCLRNHAIGWTIDRMATSCRPLIVAYHAVSSSWRSPLAITESALRSQLGYLHRSGYVGLTFADAERRTRDGTLPGDRLSSRSMTGTRRTCWPRRSSQSSGIRGRCSWSPASPIRGPRSAGTASRTSRTRPRQSCDLSPGGSSRTCAMMVWEVGSHTVTHPLLPGLSGQELREQLERSRASIADHLGGCETLAYPIRCRRRSGGRCGSGSWVPCSLCPDRGALHGRAVPAAARRAGCG